MGISYECHCGWGRVKPCPDCHEMVCSYCEYCSCYDDVDEADEKIKNGNRIQT